MDVSDIFYFFPLGGGEGASEAPGREEGFGFLLKIPQEGGGGLYRRGKGAEGPGGREGFGGGGELNIFFGAEIPTKFCNLLPCDPKSLHYSLYFS